MRKEVKYVGFYDIPGAKHPRASCLAAIDKMDYVCDALNRSGHAVNVVSPSWFSGSEAPFSKSSTTVLGEHKRLTTAPSFGVGSRPARLMQIVLALGWLFFFLVWHTRKNEKVLAYHTPWLSLPLRWAKRIRGFHLVLEMGEIYGDIWPSTRLLKYWERSLITVSDSFIVASDVLAERLGPKVKAVMCGSYKPSDYIPLQNAGLDGCIHLVYAGSIDSTKGGAIKAIESMEHLPQNYVLHVCGHGNEHEIVAMKRSLEKVNSILQRTACIFHGVLLGHQLSEQLASCHIALNPQFTGDYMLTAFPSKVIKYLSHNLPVVTTRIESVLKSPLSSLLVFSKDDTPEAIAEAIKSVDLNKPFDSRSVLRKLDAQFVKDIGLMMRELNDV